MRGRDYRNLIPNRDIADAYLNAAEIGIASGEGELLIEGVVEPPYHVTVLQRSGDVGQKTLSVEAIAAAVEITGRHQAELGFTGGALAEAAGIAQLVAGDAALARGTQIEAVDRARGIAEAQHTGLQRVSGNGARHLLYLIEIAGFVVGEQECLVFAQRAAPATAVTLVADIGLGDFGGVVVPGIRIEHRVLEEAVAGSVHGIGTVAAHQSHLSA